VEQDVLAASALRDSRRERASTRKKTGCQKLHHSWAGRAAAGEQGRAEQRRTQTHETGPAGIPRIQWLRPNHWLTSVYSADEPSVARTGTKQTRFAFSSVDPTDRRVRAGQHSGSTCTSRLHTGSASLHTRLSRLRAIAAIRKNQMTLETIGSTTSTHWSLNSAQRHPASSHDLHVLLELAAAQGAEDRREDTVCGAHVLACLTLTLNTAHHIATEALPSHHCVIGETRAGESWNAFAFDFPPVARSTLKYISTCKIKPLEPFHDDFDPQPRFELLCEGGVREGLTCHNAVVGGDFPRKDNRALCHKKCTGAMSPYLLPTARYFPDLLS